VILPDDTVERRCWSAGKARVAGLDEVGRGAWAGPVTVGVAVIDAGMESPAGLRDSKLLSEARREALFAPVASWCRAWAVGHASPAECDALGMTTALRLAAHRALASLSDAPDALLVDGRHDYVSPPDPGPDRVAATEPVPEASVDVGEVTTVVGGDARCISIAAASVLAKVTRDRLMRAAAEDFAPFEFERNKGYPSPVHRRALAGSGLTSIHRRSWSYVDDLAFR
jgi:ribonuclease HII